MAFGAEERWTNSKVNCRRRGPIYKQRVMQSNAPLERLINAVMDLDGLSENPDYAMEVRCLMRKIEWAATEAETALKRCQAQTLAREKPDGGLEDAA